MRRQLRTPASLERQTLPAPATTACPARRDNLHTIIINGRWALLGLLGAQVLAIGVAALLRCCARHRSYEEFQEDEEAAYDARRAAAAAQLESMKSKLGLAAEGGAARSKKAISEWGRRSAWVRAGGWMWVLGSAT